MKEDSKPAAWLRDAEAYTSPWKDLSFRQLLEKIIESEWGEKINPLTLCRMINSEVTLHQPYSSEMYTLEREWKKADKQGILHNAPKDMMVYPTYKQKIEDNMLFMKKFCSNPAQFSAEDMELARDKLVEVHCYLMNTSESLLTERSSDIIWFNNALLNQRKETEAQLTKTANSPESQIDALVKLNLFPVSNTPAQTSLPERIEFTHTSRDEYSHERARKILDAIAKRDVNNLESLLNSRVPIATCYAYGEQDIPVMEVVNACRVGIIWAAERGYADIVHILEKAVITPTVCNWQRIGDTAINEAYQILANRRQKLGW